VLQKLTKGILGLYSQSVQIDPFDWEMAKESVPRATELLSDVLLNKDIDTQEFLVRKFRERRLAIIHQ
jgi:hypothetical protein